MYRRRVRALGDPLRERAIAAIAAAVLPPLAVAALVYGAVRWWPRTVDDAYILFRYADNLVAGHGPVYNAGERVEGHSSPAWVALSAAAIAVDLDPVTTAKVAGLTSSIAVVVLLGAGLARSDVPGWGAGLAMLVAGSSFVLQIWSVSGMETSFFALVSFLGLLRLARPPDRPRQAAIASAFLALASLTRPEGLLYWLGGGVVAGTRGRKRWGTFTNVWAYLAPGAAIVAYYAWRWSYYGDLLPNTAYAKAGGGPAQWRQGLVGLLDFISEPAHAAILTAAAAGALVAYRIRRRREVVVMGSAALLQLAWIVGVGDDGLAVHRFYVPAFAPLVWVAALAFARGSRPTPRGARPAVACALALSVPLSFAAFHRELLPALHGSLLVYQEGNEKLGRWLASRYTPATRIAVISAGAIPYYSKLPAIDMYGLADREIARAPFPDAPGRMMKWDNASVLARRPTLIAINRGYFRANDPRLESVRRDPGALVASPMDRDLFARVAEDGGYALAPIRFDDGSVFFVFVRK
jgi:hypothetical protein